MQKKESSAIFPLLWVMLFDHTSLNITFPILTLLFFDVHSSLFSADTSQAVRSMWYGMCVAIPHVINIFAAPLLSAASDVFGRKKILLIAMSGALMFALVAALGILWGMLSLLLVSCVLRGIFSRTNPIAQAVIGDVSPVGKKVLYMGYLQTAISLGAFIGPVIGGFFANQFLFSTLNFSLPFFIAALLAAIGCVLTMVIFSETLTEKRFNSPWAEFHWQNIKNVFANPKVMRISAVLLLSQVTWSMYYQFIPPTLKTVLNFDAHMLGIFVGVIAFWLAVATTFGIRILQQLLSARAMLLSSLYLVLFGTVFTVLFCLWHVSSLIWLAAIPTAMGDVIAFSCLTAMYSDVVVKQEQGKVMGVCFIIIGLIWGLTASTGGILMSITPLLPLITAPAGILLAIMLLHRMKWF